MKKRIARVGVLALFLLVSVVALPTQVAVADGDVEQRIADFWKRVDALAPGDYLSAADLGQWALNVIERNPRARTTIADFRLSTASMQGGMDRAGLAPLAPPGTSAPGATVEQRIADFWKRVDALQSSDFLSASDLGQWALNVIERNPRARTSVADFRLSTAGMQGGTDRAGLAPSGVAPTPPPVAATPTPTVVAAAAIVITRLNYDGVVPRTESDEYVEVTNRGGAGQNMAGWKIVSVRAGQTYSFPSVTIAPGQTCRVYTNENHADSCGLSWGSSTAIWNNAGDRANLVDPSGRVVSTSGYGGY